MRVAAYLILTPILLFVGWSFVGSAFVESAGPSGGIGGMLVAVGGLLMIPLGVAVGWRYRDRSMGHLIVTPVVLFFGWRFLAVLRLWASGELPDGTGIVVVRLSALLMVPLGVRRRLALPASVAPASCPPDPDADRLVPRLGRSLGSSCLADWAGLDDFRPRGDDRVHRRLTGGPAGHRGGLASVPATHPGLTAMPQTAI